GEQLDWAGTTACGTFRILRRTGCSAGDNRRVRCSVVYRCAKKERNRNSHGGGRREKNDPATDIARCWSRSLRRLLCGSSVSAWDDEATGVAALWRPTT